MKSSDKIYRAWIPTVAGYLTFSHLGSVSIPGRIHLEDKVRIPQPDGTCWVSILQDRKLSDKLKIGKFNSNPLSGRHAFLIQSEISSSTSISKLMRGYLFSAPKEFKEILSKLHSNKLNVTDTSTAIAKLTQLSKNADNTIKTIFAFSFELTSDGCLSLEPIFNAKFDDIGKAHALEAYSFIRDLLHKHKFHSASDDAVLWPIPCDLEDDSSWRAETIKNLHRTVVTSFRNASHTSCLEALGKLSYLESFLALTHKDPKFYSLLPSINTSSLRLAIESNKNHIVTEEEAYISARSFFWAVVAIALPLLFVLIQLLQVPCIVGLSFDSEKCKAISFVVPQTFLSLVKIILEHIDICVALGMFFGLISLGGWARKRVIATFKTYSERDDIKGDLIDTILRFAISHRLSTISFITLLIILVLWMYGLFILKNSSIDINLIGEYLYKNIERIRN